jgi:hypothetical protein
MRGQRDLFAILVGALLANRLPSVLGRGCSGVSRFYALSRE